VIVTQCRNRPPRDGVYLRCASCERASETERTVRTELQRQKREARLAKAFDWSAGRIEIS
jgi:hypothetical protein